MARRNKRRNKKKQPAKPKVKVVRSDDLKSTVQRAREAGLSEEDCANLDAAIDTLEWVSSELEGRTLTLARLRSLFGLAGSEKTEKVLGKQNQGDKTAGTSSEAETAAGSTDGGTDENKDDAQQSKGHGRNAAKDYVGAKVVQVPHPTLASGDACPDCDRGKVYKQKTRPHVLVRVSGEAPLQAKVYELQSLRCNLCGNVFTADPPPGVGEEKYDETAASMIGLLKYGSGLPFNRLEGLERSLGIPLPASTQWEIVRDAAAKIAPAHEELIRQAAQGEILYNDDTAVKILSLMKENAELEASGEAAAGARTGIFTTGVISVTEGGDRRIALFSSGRNHAGENADDILRKRDPSLAPPMQMSDGLDRNVPQDATTTQGNCLVHARRKFVEIADSFPDECRHVLEALRQIYKHDAETKEQNLTSQERLEYHQKNSRPVMDDLRAWMDRQFDEKLVEPNSTLGAAIKYMTKRWEKLTLFLREPCAPLDNNLCEQALKRPILHRKNSLFYKTEKGARVGDLFMSLIHTAVMADANPFDYLVELQKHAGAVEDAPDQWMPWNYREAVKALTKT